MKKLLKFIKYTIYTLLSLFLIAMLTIFAGHKYIYPIPYSSTPTVEDIRNDEFCLGVGCHPHIETVEEFIPIFAQQIATHSRKAEKIWPDTKLGNLYALVQSIEHNKGWLISPQGDIEVVNKDKIVALAPNRPRYNIGFSHFANDTIEGVYLALSEKALNNYLEFQQYPHLGTYDLFITYTHEMFHMLEQDKRWAHPDEILNAGRNDRLGDVDARTKRTLLYQQILQAVTATDAATTDSLTLNLLATYKDYKNYYTEDYDNARYFDRTEGTAHYYELVSSLYSAYPMQVYSCEKLMRALQLLAENKNIYDDEVGLVNSSYHIGGWTCVLLDKLSDDPNQWKQLIMEQGNTTPLDILEQLYADRPLPEPLEYSDAMRERVKLKIEEEKNKKVAPGIFRMLYQLFY